MPRVSSRHHLGALGLLAAAWLITTSDVHADSVTLTSLRPGQTVVATFSTWGCFGYRSKYKLIFTPDANHPGSALVEIRNVKWLLNKTVATRTLSPEELGALDLGLSEYRKVRRGGCISTNLNQVRLKLIWDHEVITEEMYHGNTCNVHAVEGALDLEDLIYPRPDDSADISDARHNYCVQLPAGRLAGATSKAALARRS